MKNIVFLAILVFLSCWLEGSVLCCFMFCYLFCVVLFVSSLNKKVVLLHVCVVCFLFCNKTKWFLVCILWPFFLFFCCVFLFASFALSFLSKTAKTRGQLKPPEPKCRKKGNFFQWIVFLLFWGGLKKCNVCWKHYKTSGFSISWKSQKSPKSAKKVK